MRHMTRSASLIIAGWAMVLASGVAVTAVAPEAHADADPPVPSFTLVVLPDTQNAVQSKPELFSAQTDWILQHQVELNIPFVVHVGDVVEWPSRTSDWTRATAAMSPLNQQVPYAISVGNHDFDAWACTPAATCDPNASIATDRSTTNFNTYFPLSTFNQSTSFVGSFPTGRTDNTAFKFAGGGLSWLVVSLAYQPTDAEVAWANDLITQHPDCQVILNTHEYQNGADRSAIGERLWESLVRGHQNTRMVLSGHYVSTGSRVDQGDNGNTVYQVQADYQTYSAAAVNDNSYLRLMEFDAAAGVIRVRTFSPYCEATGECPAYKTDASNQFEFTAVNFNPQPNPSTYQWLPKGTGIARRG